MSQPSPPSTIARLGGQMLLARCVGIVAELGIADLVDAQPQPPADLARACGAHPDALMRVLRFLAANGIFAADEHGAIHNTPESEVLRTTVPGSLRDMVRQSWQDIVWDTYRHLPHTIRTGAPAFDAAHGADFFGFLAAHPEINARFDASMALMSGPENATIAAAYPFAGTVIDVGGGRGGLLAAILDAHPNARGVLYDQPQVLVDPARLATSAHGARCTLATGNFFASVPEGGDIYVLKRILHDWDDEKARAILRGCRAVLRAEARVLVVDAVIKPGNAPDPNKLLDVGIMALLRGRERTADEFERLFESAGLTIERIIPPAGPSTMSIVVGRNA